MRRVLRRIAAPILSSRTRIVLAAARSKLSAVILLAVVSLGLALTQVMPKRYEATASMLVEVGKTAPDPLSRGGLIPGGHPNSVTVRSAPSPQS